jgi:hypothetical protein
MFCPGCGSDDRQHSQFCRACGMDLRAVRVGLEKPDAVTSSAVTAREEIGRAVADKIRELEGAKELKKMAEDVLPELEKFLESPAEKRLRRMRAGVVTAAVGLGGMFFFYLLSISDPDARFLFAIGLTAFLIGLGIIVNGVMLTLPKEDVPDQSPRARLQNALDRSSENSALRHGDLNTAQQLTPPPSVIEHTTHRLPNEASAAVPQRNAGE